MHFWEKLKNEAFSKKLFLATQLKSSISEHNPKHATSKG